MLVTVYAQIFSSFWIFIENDVKMNLLFWNDNGTRIIAIYSKRRENINRR